MNCLQVEKLLGEYLDRRLEKQLSEALAGHLQSCPACQEQLENLRAALEMLKTCPPVALPEGFIARTQAAVRQKAPKPKANPWRTARWLAPAFGLLLLTLIAWWPFMHSRQKSALRSYEYAAPQAVNKSLSPSLEEKAAPPPMPSIQKPSPERGKGEVEKIAAAGKPTRAAISKDEGKGKQALPKLPAISSAPIDKEQAVATPGLMSEERTAMPARVKSRAEVGSQAPLSGPPNSGVIAGGAPAATRGSARTLSQNPLFNFTVKTKAADGAYDVLLQATPNNTGNITVYPVSRQENVAALSAATTLSTAKSTVLRQSPEKAGEVWGVNIAWPLADKAQPAPELGKVFVSGQEYRLMVPPRQFNESAISVDFRGVAAQVALQEISEKAGIIILAPASAQGLINLNAKQAPPDAVLQVVADQLDLRYEKRGGVRNLY